MQRTAFRFECAPLHASHRRNLRRFVAATHDPRQRACARMPLRRFVCSSDRVTRSAPAFTIAAVDDEGPDEKAGPVRATDNSFDLVLSFLQWQGSGRPENLRRGAMAAAEVCRNHGPLVRVPEAGEGETRGGIHRWTAIAEQFRSAQAILDARQPRRILTAGGDCACDIAVIDYLHRRYPDLTVIWIDAHLDANTVDTTPSGNFHGMPVAAIMGSAPRELQALLSTPLSPARFRYVSAHVGDEGDWAFQRAHALEWLEPATNIVDEALSGPIHIHFDLDALDPAAFPHVAYPDGRLSLDAGLAWVRNAAVAGLVGLTITEFAPADERAAQDGSRFIERLCEAARPASSDDDGTGPRSRDPRAVG
jgi:arginase